MRKNDHEVSTLAKGPESMMRRIKHFLWWCAGADVDILKECLTDHARFTALGMMVLVVPCIASVSFAFFTTQTFGLSILPALVGMAWGGVVFVLDRLILTFHRKGRLELVRAIPRLVLAASLALLIGEPLLVRMFQKEIDLQLRSDAQTVVTSARRVAETRFQPEREALANRSRELQTRLDELKRLRDEKEAAVIGEIEGRVGSGIKGDGPAAARKQQAFADAKAAYDEAITQLLPQINRNNQRLAEIQATIDEEAKTINESHKAAGGGMMARHQALFAIIKGEPGAALTYVPLFLILILLEIAPLVNKLTFPPGEYDRQLTLRQKNAIEQGRRVAALEREKQKRLASVKSTLMKRIVGVVTGVPVISTAPQEREVAELLRFTVLDQFRAEILAAQTHHNGHKTFGPEVAIEVVEHPELRVSLQLPAQSRASITLTNLAGELKRIGDEIAQDHSHPVVLVKATSSLEHEVQRDLPLLPQLERDQTLRLTYARDNQQRVDLPLTWRLGE